MSLAGLREFSNTLNKLMNSEVWRQIDDGEKLELGYILIKSNIGRGVDRKRLGNKQYPLPQGEVNIQSQAEPEGSNPSRPITNK